MSAVIKKYAKVCENRTGHWEPRHSGVEEIGRTKLLINLYFSQTKSL
jgi:hypothetical protein